MVNQAKVPFGQLNSLTTIQEDIDDENQDAIALAARQIDLNPSPEFNTPVTCARNPLKLGSLVKKNSTEDDNNVGKGVACIMNIAQNI